MALVTAHTEVGGLAPAPHLRNTYAVPELVVGPVTMQGSNIRKQ